MARRPERAPGSLRGKVKPRDPFELIRWLALSQPDPRKALAELIQNSLDAQASRIIVQRVRHRGSPCLRIQDNGEGVIPELDRPEALRYIATNIGHSRKRHLSPKQRYQLMTQGQYGIGLLGFWSLGQTLEIWSSVPGQKPYRLVLHRDQPHFLVEPLRSRLPLEERWTEVFVTDLHRDASLAVSGRRASDYLAAELRGQLLARKVELIVQDRMARGGAQKQITVRPPRFLGDKIENFPLVAVPGQPPIRIELYWQGASENGGTEHHGIAVYAAGTLVAGSFEELASLDLDHLPWTDRRITGMIDFPGFHIAPGSRRGIIPDETAESFSSAIRVLEPKLIEILRRFEQEQEEAKDRTLIRDLQRAFRDFYRRRPQFAMLPVQEKGDFGVAGDSGVLQGGPGIAAPDVTPAAFAPENDGNQILLLPAGPLAGVEVRPGMLRVACGGTRKLSARGVDAAGRPITKPVVYQWDVIGQIGELSQPHTFEGNVTFTATGVPANGMLRVLASCEDDEAQAEVVVDVVDEVKGRSDEGIPEPEFLHQPGSPWRSRMSDGRWEVNSGHADYRAVAERPALKLRYLANLFAKEVVLRSHQDPRFAEPLEQLVEIAAYADLHLTQTRRKERKKDDALDPS